MGIFRCESSVGYIIFMHKYNVNQHLPEGVFTKTKTYCSAIMPKYNLNIQLLTMAVNIF